MYIFIVNIIWLVVSTQFLALWITGSVCACLVLLEIIIFRNRIFEKTQKLWIYIIDILFAIIFSIILTKFISVFKVNYSKFMVLVLGLSNFLLGLYYAGVFIRAICCFISRIKKNKNKLITSLLLCTSFSVMFFVFLPSEVMLNNLKDYIVSYQIFVLPELAAAVVVSVLLIVVINILDDKLAIIITNLIFSSFLGMYLQNYFANQSLGIINGQVYEWKKHIFMSVLNLIFWLAIFVVPFVISKKKKKEIYDKIIRFISVLLFIMQGASLSVQLINSPQEAFTMKNYYFDNSEQYYVGEEENVILFVLDAVDNRYVMDLLQKKSEVFKEYKDFTLYTNTCSVFDETFDSMPQMLSGSTYKATPVDFADFYNRLHENGYIITAYNYECESNFNDVKIYFDNYHFVENENLEMEAMDTENMDTRDTDEDMVTKDTDEDMDSEDLDNNSWKTEINMTNENKKEKSKYYDVHYEGILINNTLLTLYQTLPNVLKSSIRINNIDFKNVVIYYKESAPAIYENDDFKNNMNVCCNGKKRFVIQHLDGAHAPKDDFVETTEELLYMLKDYMDELKELGVYDDSVIIITADHGMHDNVEELFQTAGTPIFMIKEKGNDFDKMRISSAPVYHTDFLKTILLDINLYYEEDGDRFGSAIYDFSENEKRERRWYNREFRSDYSFYYEYTYTGTTDDLIQKVENGEYQKVNLQ